MLVKYIHKTEETGLDLNRSKNIYPEKIDTIISKLLNKPELTHNLKEISLKNLWTEIIDKKFKDCTELFSVIKRNNNEDIALVGGASSVVVQELTLYKQKILNKLKQTGGNLGFNITDVIINTKYYIQKVPAKNINASKIMHCFDKKPTVEELTEIIIPESLNRLFNEAVTDISGDFDKNKLLELITLDIKMQIWKKNKGFPCCERCSIPVDFYIENEPILCPACKYKP